ncbi:MAG: hypothetical protein ACRC2R_03590 [Xenococcaceae cyanobacterium]
MSRLHRSVIYRMLDRHREAIADLEIALENAPDEDIRQQIEQTIKRYSKHKT